jgi:hypothetical protein
MKDRWVYALIDPDDNLVHYVGNSCNPDARYRDHLCQARKNYEYVNAPVYDWMRDVLDRGLQPQLLLLEEGDGEVEKKWISFFANAGHPITNLRKNPKLKSTKGLLGSKVVWYQVA